MLVLLQKEGRKEEREGGRKDRQLYNMVCPWGMERNLTDLSHIASAGLRSLLDST